MKLAKHDPLPHLVEFLLRVFVLFVPNGDNSCQKLDVVKKTLNVAVVKLGASLSSVYTTMKLEVQLSVPCHEARRLFFQSIKELVDGCTSMDTGNDSHRISHTSKSPEPFHVLPGWAASAITLSKLESSIG